MFLEIGGQDQSVCL